jgi:flavin-dependent dehydrogenase
MVFSRAGSEMRSPRHSTSAASRATLHAMERRPLIIVGSGPAGTASALFLQRQHPELAREVLILEKAQHPRPKVCAGGLIPHTLECLRHLDVPLSVANVAVHRVVVDVPGRSIGYEDGEMCRVVRRDTFDHSLVVACRQRGIEVREDEKVLELRRDGDGVRIETERTSYHAPVVIGADGSGSAVRRQLVAEGRQCVGKAVMADVPVAAVDWSGFAEARYDFSFTAVAEGLRGYVWAFPCLIGDTPHVNVGAYSVDANGTGPELMRLLRAQLGTMGAPPVPVKSFPIRWYGKGVRIAAPRVLLVGDAAGVDPLMGEGISFAFEYGRRAASAVTRAWTTGNWSFADYEREVATSWMGRKLRRLGTAVRLFYGPAWRLCFPLAARSRHAQQIAVRWYNGVDGLDQRSSWELFAAWMRGGLPPNH